MINIEIFNNFFDVGIVGIATGFLHWLYIVGLRFCDL